MKVAVKIRMQSLRLFVGLSLALVLFGSCKALTGKTLGRHIDDAAITTTVKTRLASQHASSLARIDVDTNDGVVYLSGTVESIEFKEQATKVAGQVDGVRQVVNNLQVQR